MEYAARFAEDESMKDHENQLASEHKLGFSRRTLLQGLGTAGVASSFALPMMRSARAADPVVLRWWSPQASPDQLAMYKAQIATFEAAHPGVKIAFEPTSDEGYPAQFAAAFARAWF
eukprot:gene36560-43568_t